jgi:hypothetical protein
MKYIKLSLQLLGALFLALAIFSVSYYFYLVRFERALAQNLAASNEVAFVFNWGNLGQEKIEKVLNSYRSDRSDRSMSGDHLDAYEILAKEIPLQLLSKENGWTQGSKLSNIQIDAIELISSFAVLDDLAWFPKESELKSENVFIYTWSVQYHGDRATSAQVIFAVPSHKKVYYSSVKM